mmetsp:Transcript_11216/g.14079  ORF Transcript_11216/g.14079 Transcript_11216/m.14079 type:complete len:515 (+) Transcript_11216:46-1590(+)
MEQRWNRTASRIDGSAVKRGKRCPSMFIFVAAISVTNLVCIALFLSHFISILSHFEKDDTYGIRDDDGDDRNYQDTLHSKNDNIRNNWWRWDEVGNHDDYENDSRFHDHPHKGAMHDGVAGMVVNPSPDRLEKITFDKSNLKLNQTVKQNVLCPSRTNDNDYIIEGEGGRKVLEKVKGGLLKSIQYMNSEDEDDDEGTDTHTHYIAGEQSHLNLTKQSRGRRKGRRSRILCMVYTFHTPQDNHSNLRSQAHTWGKRCDGFFGASNYTDHSVGAINLLHAGKEEYDNMWQKVRSLWAYVNDHYKDDYDFFYICGDDVYVAVENLRAYLDGPEIERLENGYVDAILGRYSVQSKKWEEKRPRPLILGSPFLHKNCPNPDGGSGYVMNSAAVELFAAGLSEYFANITDPREDLFIGGYFCEKGMFLVDTRHAVDGGWRFSYGAETSYTDESSPLRPERLSNKLGFEIKTGIDVVSEEQISFHFKSEKARVVTNHGYKISDLMYRYEAILYDLCDNFL